MGLTRAQESSMVGLVYCAQEGSGLSPEALMANEEHVALPNQGGGCLKRTVQGKP
jgi:hypothetical protein